MAPLRFLLRFLGLPALAVATYLVTIGSPWQPNQLPVGTQVLAVSLAAILTWMCVNCALRSDQIDLFAPEMIFAICIFVGFILPLRGFAFGTDHFTDSFPFPFPSRTDAINHALEVVIAGSVAFAAGVRLCVQRRSPQSTFLRSWNISRLRSISVIYTTVALAGLTIGIFALGGISRVFDALHDRIRDLAGLNYYFDSSLLLAVVALLWLGWLSSTHRRLGLSFYLYSLFSFGCLSLLGSKALFLVLILAGIGTLNYFHARVTVSQLAVVFLVATLSFGAYDIYLREYLVAGRVLTLNRDESWLETAQNVLERMVSSNFVELQNLSIVVDAVPTLLPEQKGRTYLALLVAPVPRSLWPGKFLPSTGIYTNALWPDSFSGHGTTMPPGFVGELYINFELIGVIGGMLLFGALYGHAYRQMLTVPNDPQRVLFYTVLAAVMVHYIRGDSYAATIMLLEILLPLQSAYWWLNRADRGAQFKHLAASGPTSGEPSFAATAESEPPHLPSHSETR